MKLFPQDEYRWIQVKVVDEQKAEAMIENAQLKNEFLNKHGLEITRLTLTSELNHMDVVKVMLEQFLERIESEKRSIRVD